jgi:hypothetical protein
VGADVYYRIASPECSITNVQNLDRSTRVLLQTSLIKMLVRLPLARIDGRTNGIAQDVQVRFSSIQLFILCLFTFSVILTHFLPSKI